MENLDVFSVVTNIVAISWVPVMLFTLIAGIAVAAIFTSDILDRKG